MSSKNKAKPRHVPQRTCVGCRETSSKRQFVRIVRTPAGTVEVDPTGKRPARGAYLCHTPKCWEHAVKKGRLENALRAKLSADDREALLRYGAERIVAEVS